MKIHIFYTHYNVTITDGKYRPLWFDYEKCFLNLLKTIEENSNIILHVIMDGEIDNNWIRKYKDKFVSHEVVGGDMVKAGHAMFNLLKQLKNTLDDKDLIYILENDYLHQKGWIEEIIKLYETFKLDNCYVSLYDHNDKYTWMHLYENLVSKIFTTETHHWRTIPNTCGSYICTKKLFFEDIDDQIREVGDANKWLWLEQNKGRFLLSPIPGLSTHCMETLLSPTIDWKKISDQA